MGGGRGKKGIVEKLKKQSICKEDIQVGSKEKRVNMMEIWSNTGLF